MPEERKTCDKSYKSDDELIIARRIQTCRSCINDILCKCETVGVATYKFAQSLWGTIYIFMSKSIVNWIVHMLKHHCGSCYIVKLSWPGGVYMYPTLT